MKIHAEFDKCSQAITLMPQFFTFLHSVSRPLMWNEVNTMRVYEMYKSFIFEMNTKMFLHLWGRFSGLYLPPIRVIGGNCEAFNSITKEFFRVNQDPQFPWKPKRKQVFRYQFGLISKISIKMATGPYKFAKRIYNGYNS
jgi:hypothetical protein